MKCPFCHTNPEVVLFSYDVALHWCDVTKGWLIKLGCVWSTEYPAQEALENYRRSK